MVMKTKVATTVFGCTRRVNFALAHTLVAIKSDDESLSSAVRRCYEKQSTGAARLLKLIYCACTSIQLDGGTPRPHYKIEIVQTRSQLKITTHILANISKLLGCFLSDSRLFSLLFDEQLCAKS
jgi:hypothetical protein